MENKNLGLLEHPNDTVVIAEAIKSMKPNTAPGAGSFTVEFYKEFSETLQLILVNLFQCIDDHKLPGG